MQYDKYNLKATLQPHHEPFNSYGGGGGGGGGHVF